MLPMFISQFLREQPLVNRLVGARETYFPVSRYPGREFNIWWLSTGRCGSHFIRHCCSAARGVEIGKLFGLSKRLWDEVVDIYLEDRERFWELKLEDFPVVRAKVNARNNHPCPVFTEIGHTLYPFAAMIHDYSRRTGRPDRLVHLIRNPVDCCRSRLKAERMDGPRGFSRRASAYFEPDDAPAVRAAKTWIGVNTMCAEMARHLDDPDHVLFIRIEDLNAETAVDMLERIGLTDIDHERLGEVFGSEFTSLRHSHVARTDLRTAESTDEEAEIVRELTRETAAGFGYEI